LFAGLGILAIRLNNGGVAGLYLDDMELDWALAGTVDPELELVERARAGDREAYGALAERHWPSLVRLARAVLADERDAEDLAQEALVHAWRRLASLRDPARFGAWLRRSLVRRSLRRGRGAPPGAVELGEVAAAPGSDPLARLELRRLLATLSPRQRAALVLSEIEGWSDREIADVLGVAAPTVRVHRFLARRALARRLREAK
jgi:RNA polymerase sigma-70 factor (ECF subfamily)